MAISLDLQRTLQNIVTRADESTELINALNTGEASTGANTSLSNLVSPIANVPINMNGFKINNLANPVAAQDAATKAYVDAGSSSDWALTGNAGTTAGTNFLGTTDAQSLVFKTNSAEAMRIDQPTSRLFIGTTSSIGASNSGIQYADATTANRGQIKLHSFFNGASIAGVSTLTSRSGVVGINAAVVAGQDYSKWTAQAAATTPGSAPISGAFAFKANTVNSLTVTSDYHIQLTNLAGTLADRLYLTSEGLLQLPGYGAGVATFDASGNVTSVPAVAQPQILVFTSSTSVSGAAAEAVTFPGLLATDLIVAVTQVTPGASNLPLLGYSAQANNTLTLHWVADPSTGYVAIVTVKR